MYKTGHIGVTLLLFAPVAHVLVRAGDATLAAFVGAVMLWFAMLPDVDHRLPGVSHRGSTHTVLFAALVGAVFAGAGYFAAGALDLESVSVARFGFLLGAATVGAHLVGDVLTPAGVAPFWPLSGRRYSLRLTRANNPFVNYGLFTLGVFAAAAAVATAVGV